VGLDDVAAICLTHLDYDHFNMTWLSEILRRKIYLHCHEDHVDALLARANNRDLAPRVRPFNGQAFLAVPGVRARSFALPHDELGSFGFVFDARGGRIGYASDLGRCSGELVRHFRGLNVLAIESNYDPRMQINSSRPWSLKRRIMGGSGHLSNQQALDAVRQILDRCQKDGEELPRHIVLLHRSRQCNCPRLLRKLFSSDRRIAPRLILAEQDRATSWLWARPQRGAGAQLELQWG
jgi:phosphoribosyl 1,2-cyclic phosphodiesterase